MKILHLIPSLDYGGAAAQLGLLSKHLTPTVEMHICCLGGEGVWTGRLRQHGRTVDCLNWKRVFDPTPPWRLHRLLKSFQPDAVHTWGPPALRALGLVGRRWLPRTVVSRPLPHRLDELKPLDRWLLRRVRTVAASSQAEATLCRTAGVRDGQVVVVPPAVEVDDSQHPPRHGHDNSILCIGALAPHKGFRDAIWAFDMLHVVVKNIRLKLIGDGPLRSELEHFVTCLNTTETVNFLGRRDDVSRQLHDADVCWIPTRTGTSQQVALEAMAAGCPVVAVDRPGMRELIVDGVTGFVAPPGDKVAVCKPTRRLLADAGLKEQIGAAARQHVKDHFQPATCVQRWMEEYAAAA